MSSEQPDERPFAERAIGANVAQIVAIGVANGVEDVNRMLRAHARRYRPGKDFAPHLHAVAIRDGWRDGMRRMGAPGAEQHAQFGVISRPDLLHLVGTTMSVLSADYVAARMSTVPHDEFAAYEVAVTDMLQAYGGEPNNRPMPAWLERQIRVKRALTRLKLRPGAATDLWDIVDALEIDRWTREEILAATQELLPTHLYQEFNLAYQARYSD